MGCHVVYGKPLSTAAMTGFSGPRIHLADVVRTQSPNDICIALPPAIVPRIGVLDCAAMPDCEGPPSRELLAQSANLFACRSAVTVLCMTDLAFVWL
jgi:hypothetical protein